MFDFFAGVTAAILSVAKVLRLRKPAQVFLVLVGEKDMSLEFKLTLPEPGAADVKKGGKRELRVQIGAAAPETYTLPGTAMESETLVGPQGASVSGSLVDIDDVGNRSEPSEFNYELLDTIAPAKPGAVGLQVTAEVDDEEVTPPADPVGPEDPEAPSDPGTGEETDPISPPEEPVAPEDPAAETGAPEAPAADESSEVDSTDEDQQNS